MAKKNLKQTRKDAVTVMNPLLERKPMRHDKWLNLAHEIARHSTETHSLGAIIVRSGNVLSTGFNKMRNDVHACSNLEESGVHAEMDALNSCRNPDGATIYVSRRMADETKGTSLPCWRCARTLQEAGVKKVVYIDDSGETATISFKGRVPSHKAAYLKANESFGETNCFAFRGIFYAWADLISA